ncbi:alpha/beta fold hydrolase [Streptomyces sp. NPDC006372]|uniref:thioesterase II family protein n=1 Tax=Streptomyces sp. NPDC006372 TaxID=3155599 RepID=UPI0033BEDD84
MTAPLISGTKWLGSPMRQDQGLTRLFCFPFAGGGPSAFRSWLPYLENEVELLPVHLPGRERRRQEAPIVDADALATAAAEAIAPWVRSPYAMYGHSMGALLAHRVVRNLLADGHPAPERVFVAARRAPHLPPDSPLVHELPRKQLVERLRDMGGTPSELLDDDHFLDTVEPLIRADFRVSELARLMPADDPLPVSVVALGGLSDAHVSRASLREWHRHTSGTFTLHTVTGGHFFHTENAHAVTRLVVRELYG